MRFLALVAILVAIANPAVGVAEQPLSPPLLEKRGTVALTPERLLELAPPVSSLIVRSGLAWVGQSERLVYSTYDWHDRTAVIVLLDTSTGEQRRIAIGTAPLVSPNGQQLAYIVGMGDDSVVAVRSLDSSGSGVERVLARYAHTDAFSLAFTWSPDSRTLLTAYRPPFDRAWSKGLAPGGESSSQQDPSDASTELTPGAKAESTAIDFDAPDVRPQKSQLWLHDIARSTAQQIWSEDGVVSDLVWHPHKNEILYTSSTLSYETAGDETRTSLTRLDLESGRTNRLREFSGHRQALSPRVSPDGLTLALNLDFDNSHYDVMPSIGVLQLEGAAVGQLRQLTNDVKMRGAEWSADGDMIFARRLYGPFPQLYALNVQSGQLVQLTHEAAAVEDAAIQSRLGGKEYRIALLTRDAHDTIAVSIGSLSEHASSSISSELAAKPSTSPYAVRSSFSEIANVSTVPESLRLGEVREVRWSVSDGVESRGALFLPPDYTPTRRYPLILDLHGGLIGSNAKLYRGALLYTTALEFHMWAARGYAVLVPEFRSSAALGLNALKRMREEQDPYGFHGDERDILGAVDSLIAVGIADANRIGLVGMSGGATLTNWLVARTRNRFRVALSCDGFAEIYFATAVGASAGGDASFAESIGGWNWDIPWVYLRNSAIFYASGATTPTMFLMGESELSGADPSLSSQFLYTALKRQGVPSRYIRYAGEGHGLVQPANRRDSLLRAVDWVDRHMSQ